MSDNQTAYSILLKTRRQSQLKMELDNDIIVQVCRRNSLNSYDLALSGFLLK